ncbi:acyl-CoA thioesterase [Nostocoides sp. F2B08]|uniref:acyl-CoA thioesterase n=1 Tax=Nostocoides sp. F2B08 TaxID=2653936 RepID=UPI001263AE57|nr:thioesterase family protein [Tetrasphaera sp. F2B08]KAB7746379.1 acyl-CoA thioesterase [Tetrasphaera sp. F2B08]
MADETPADEPVAEPLAGYPHRATFPTRWNDNDVYGHVNNTVHYLAMDTVINAWMIEHAGLRIDPAGDAPVGLCVESGCRYLAPAEYPDTLTVGLRVGALGTSSVTWELGMVRGDGTLVAEGRFVHVFVDKATRRPTPIPERARGAIEGLRSRS